MRKQMEPFIVIKQYLKIAVLIASIILICACKPWFTVHPGETAIQLRLGKIINYTDDQGLYFKIPLIDKVIFINNRIIKTAIETEALSHDLQFVSIGVAINYRIKDAKKLYELAGTDIEKLVIDPFAQESIKAIVAKYTAEQLIQLRHEAKDKVCQELRERLEPFQIALVDFNFVHLDFHKDFLNAVEQKQIALQSALTARNLTERVKEEALQAKERADAESYAMEVKRRSVNKDTIILKMIEKWDGKLPVTMTGNVVPFLDIIKE